MQKIENNQLYSLRYKIAEPFFNDIYKENYAIIKGSPFSMQVYNNYGHRKSNDIDLLINRKDIILFENILKRHGFEINVINRHDRILCISSSHQLPPYRKGIVEIDMNFDILWGEYIGNSIDITEFLSDTVEMTIYGCKVKTLTPLKAMVQLILHHYKDLNSIFLLATRNTINQDMFKDLFYLLKNNLSEITLEKLYAISIKYDLVPYVYYMLYYTGLLFKDEVLEKYIAGFKTLEGEALLNCYGLNEVERHKWKVDFHTRLESKYLYDLIKDDLTEKDLEKIAINKKVFLGE